MPEPKDVLRERTFKGEYEDVAHRVYHTLSDKKELQEHRTMHVLAGLIDLLIEKGMISESELDNLLLASTG